jgi:hypothetical protein
MADYLNTIRAACGIQCTVFRTNPFTLTRLFSIQLALKTSIVFKLIRVLHNFL